MNGIFRLDDGGATFHINAIDHDDALKKWTSHMADDCASDDYDDPEITKLQLTEAASVMVRDDDYTAPCPTCGTSNMVPAERSLLEVWQQDNALPADKRARHGILCCSEWP